MAAALILQRVNVYDTFPAVYDSVTPMQAGAVTAESLYRMVVGPDNVLVIHELDSLDTARWFSPTPNCVRQWCEAVSKANPASSSSTDPALGSRQP